MVKVTLESGTKKLPNVSIVAMKRNPKTGRIVNQEWWTAASFAKLSTDLVGEATTTLPVEAYKADSIPNWLKWVLGKPTTYHYEYFDDKAYRDMLKKAIQDRLDEDLNRSN